MARCAIARATGRRASRTAAFGASAGFTLTLWRSVSGGWGTAAGAALGNGFVDFALPSRPFFRASVMAQAAFEFARCFYWNHSQFVASGHRQLDCFQQLRDLLRFQFAVPATLQILAQFNDPVAHALKAADFSADRIPETPDFTLAAFAHHHLEPLVGAFTAERFNFVKMTGAILQLHAVLQLLERAVGNLAVDPAQVLALDLARRMHQTVGQFAIRGEQQQTRGIQIQTTNRDPAQAFEARQPIEYRGASLRVDQSGHFALGLVVGKHAWTFVGHGANHELATIELDALTIAERVTDGRRPTIDLDFAAQHAFFNHASRAQAGFRQEFLESLRADQIGAAFEGQGRAAFH
jgi:hypothetical protein